MGMEKDMSRDAAVWARVNHQTWCRHDGPKQARASSEKDGTWEYWIALPPRRLV